MTQKQAVQEAITAGKDSPSDGAAYVKEKFGIELSKQGFSTIKSQLKKASGQGGTRGRGRQARAAPAGANGAANLIQHMQAIKALCDRLGVDQVKQIAELFRR
jgi:hypothetical protein